MTHGSLFSGIGGFDLAAEWMGWDNLFHCEWNSFGQKVLKYYWPNAVSYEDITKTDFTIWRGRIDVLTGGFPCQPYSLAGKRKGKDDERHLWPEMLRAIREIRPTWVVGENVFGLVNWNGGLVFDEVQTDLEAEGYEVQPYVLPACAINAPHRRDRIWFVAHAKNSRVNGINANDNGEEGKNWSGYDKSNCIGKQQDATDSENTRFTPCFDGQRQKQFGRRNESMGSGQWDRFPTQSPICTGDDGLSSRLDSITFPKWRNQSIKAAGNAVVPQVVFQIFKSINSYVTIYG